MTDDQLELELYIELCSGDEEYELGEDLRPTRLWSRSGFASIRSSCLWRPVETVALAAGGPL